ncbi:helix-turn-helix domain-containing protein [Campylobacter insulaenigrae]|uniref:helix-turn-helix domain-containing protein n=1 Tax=Campylobacter insulaenigrae TaxID=260714 RepID=UPI0021535DE2|nr:helix-turn-helix transcriptional regulator [Campylobacter insulaenigrae]MCR6574321.1 helix-turn-helix domain-containing protein [Campylobacter insulaenigrae]
MRIKYSKKKISKILKEINEKLPEQSLSSLLEEYEIPKPTYYTWKRRYPELKEKEEEKEEDLNNFQIDDKAIGSRIRKIRESMQLSINQFVKNTPYVQQQITYFENGQRKVSIHFLTVIYLKYGINPNYIILNQEPQFIFTEYNKNKISKFNNE